MTTSKIEREDLQRMTQELVDQRLTAMRSQDRGRLREINREQRYVARRLRWLEVDRESPEQLQRFSREATQDYQSIQQQIDVMESESEREGLHTALEAQWRPLLREIQESLT